MEARVMNLLLLMAVGVSASAAAVPGCCAPDQWQAKIRQVRSVGYDLTTVVTLREMLSTYDAATQRIVVMMNETTLDGTKRTIEHDNFKTGKGFVYNIDTNSCKSKDSGFNFKKYCTSVRGIVTKNVWKELGDRNVPATSMVYEHHANNTSDGYYELEVVKSDNCIPIYKVMLHLSSNRVQVYHRTTMEATDCIASNEVFRIPAACRTL